MKEEKLGDYIKEIRKEKELSQRELARRIDVDNSYISRIEKGLIDKVSISILISLASELNISLKKLVKLSNYKESEIQQLFEYNYRNYDEVLLNNDFDDLNQIEKYIVIDEDGKNIDIGKVLNAYKNNKINKKQAVALITACRPIEIDNQLIYPSAEGDIIIDLLP